MPAARKEFTAQLETAGESGAWTVVALPFDVEQEFGRKGRVAAAGTLNGFPYRSSIFPMGNGTHWMMVNKTMQAGAGVTLGETVEVVMEPDTAPRIVVVPPELETALAGNSEARAAFERLAYSHQKAYVDWIEGAKKPETRARRVDS